MVFATPFERYIAPARAKPQLWRFLLGLLLALAVYIALAVAVFAISALVVEVRGEPGEIIDWMLGTPSGVLVLLATFSGMAFGPMVAAWALHGRAPGTLFGRGAQVVRDFLIAAGIVLAIALPTTGISLLFLAIEPGLALSTWVMLLPLTLAGIALQTLAEELVFRGYILQQMAARFRSPLAWMVLPSIVFASLHYDAAMPPGVSAMAMGSILLFALAAADLTARTGSIGAAWGIHFANNVSAIALVSVGDTINGLSLGHTAFSAHDADLSPAIFLLDFGLIGLAWFLCTRALSR